MELLAQIGGGLVLLALGGEGVIRGAVGIARKLGLSQLLIGLTLVGFGTSAPELLTSVNAALDPPASRSATSSARTSATCFWCSPWSR